MANGLAGATKAMGPRGDKAGDVAKGVPTTDQEPNGVPPAGSVEAGDGVLACGPAGDAAREGRPEPGASALAEAGGV